MNSSLYAARRRRNGIMLSLSLAATLLGVGWLIVILVVLLWEGFSGLSLAVFTEMTPPPGADGGLLNPILLSAPSIVVGLFIYEVMVAPMGHFSGLAGAVALAVIVIPVVVRTTEDMLILVPNPLREAASALGLPRAVVIAKVCYRAAKAGMITGVLLAIARISGETAPLLFTSLNNQFWSTNLNAPISSLPVVIFQFALSPYKDWQKLAWTGALIITFTVLALSIMARALSASRKQS